MKQTTSKKKAFAVSKTWSHFLQSFATKNFFSLSHTKEYLVILFYSRLMITLISFDVEIWHFDILTFWHFSLLLLSLTGLALLCWHSRFGYYNPKANSWQFWMNSLLELDTKLTWNKDAKCNRSYPQALLANRKYNRNASS